MEKIVEKISHFETVAQTARRNVEKGKGPPPGNVASVSGRAQGPPVTPSLWHPLQWGTSFKRGCFTWWSRSRFF